MDDIKEDKRWKLFDEINKERHRQDDRWGEQNHRVLAEYSISATLEDMRSTHGIMSQGFYRTRAESKRTSWLDILMEEVAEFAEAAFVHGYSSDEARKELIQVIAVGVSMLECMDRRREENRKAVEENG